MNGMLLAFENLLSIQRMLSNKSRTKNTLEDETTISQVNFF